MYFLSPYPFGINLTFTEKVETTAAPKEAVTTVPDSKKIFKALFSTLLSLNQSIHFPVLLGYNCDRNLTAKFTIKSEVAGYFMKGHPYDCIWTIRAPKGKKVLIRVLYYNTVDCCDLLIVSGDDVSLKYTPNGKFVISIFLISGQRK